MSTPAPTPEHPNTPSSCSTGPLARRAKPVEPICSVARPCGGQIVEAGGRRAIRRHIVEAFWRGFARTSAGITPSLAELASNLVESRPHSEHRQHVLDIASKLAESGLTSGNRQACLTPVQFLSSPGQFRANPDKTWPSSAKLGRHRLKVARVWAAFWPNSARLAGLAHKPADPKPQLAGWCSGWAGMGRPGVCSLAFGPLKMLGRLSACGPCSVRVSVCVCVCVLGTRRRLARSSGTDPSAPIR